MDVATDLSEINGPLKDGSTITPPKKVLLRRPRPKKEGETNDIKVNQVQKDFSDLETPPTSLIREPRSKEYSRSSNKKLPKLSAKDKKWVLDSAYRSRQQTSQSRYGKNYLHHYKPRGPDALPAREVRKQFNLLGEFLRSDEDIRYSKPPLFTLNDFTLKMAEKHKVDLCDVHKVILSSANYKKMMDMVATKLHQRYDHISFVDVDLDALETIEEAPQRVPPTQILFEMAALIKEQVKESLNFEVECKVKRLPRYAAGYRLGEAPHSEIVLFEKQRARELQRFVQKDRFTGHPTNESLFTTGPMLKHFQQGTRSASPFTVQDENQISPAEICVLDCLLTGGIALSLKACFVDELPDISALQRTLTYVNLSYNNFKELPKELLQLSSLQILKLRNNPITALPHDIHRLSQLESLIVSFCLVSVIPVSLYSLENLRILDLSYNRISFLHREIKQLKSLSFLNMEGNELTSLPNTMLRMRLRKIKVRNNFLHPLLWKENSVNQPQQLQDTAALAFYHHGLHRQYCMHQILAHDAAQHEHQLREDAAQHEHQLREDAAQHEHQLREDAAQHEHQLREDAAQHEHQLREDAAQHEHQLREDAAQHEHQLHEDAAQHGHQLPEDARHLLVSQLSRCECCLGPQFGAGLRLIRPARSLFGVRYLPLLFTSCSPSCRAAFLKADAEIAEQLYDTDCHTARTQLDEEAEEEEALADDDDC